MKIESAIDFPEIASRKQFTDTLNKTEPLPQAALDNIGTALDDTGTTYDSFQLNEKPNSSDSAGYARTFFVEAEPTDGSTTRFFQVEIDADGNVLELTDLNEQSEIDLDSSGRTAE